jgi:hypothetical protein
MPFSVLPRASIDECRYRPDEMRAGSSLLRARKYPLTSAHNPDLVEIKGVNLSERRGRNYLRFIITKAVPPMQRAPATLSGERRALVVVGRVPFSAPVIGVDSAGAASGGVA